MASEAPADPSANQIAPERVEITPGDTSARKAARAVVDRRTTSVEARWFGDKGALGSFGVPEGKPTAAAIANTLLGQQAKDKSTAVHTRRPAENEPMVHLGMTIDAPQAINDRWASADADGRKAILDAMFAGADAATKALAPNRAATASVGVVDVFGPADAPRLQIRTIAVGSKVGKEVRSAFDAERHTEEAGKRAWTAAMKPLRALERSKPALEARAPAEAQMEQAAQAAETPVVEEAPPAPAVEASQVEQPALAPPTLTDNLTWHYNTLGPVYALRIRRDAEELRNNPSFGYPTDEELRARLAASTAFDGLTSERGRTYRRGGAGWSKDVVAHVAAELTRISYAMHEHGEVIKRRIADGDHAADPIRPILPKGPDFVGKVLRHGTVKASRLQNATPEQYARYMEEIEAQRSLPFASLANDVALQFCENAEKDAAAREAELERQRTPAIEASEKTQVEAPKEKNEKVTQAKQVEEDGIGFG